jgi:hypothetical protein
VPPRDDLKDDENMDCDRMAFLVLECAPLDLLSSERKAMDAATASESSSGRRGTVLGKPIASRLEQSNDGISACQENEN